MRCPKCNQEMTQVGQFWFCGNDITNLPIKTSRPSPAKLTTDHRLASTISQLPTPLSISLTEFFTELYPYITFHRLTDSAEIITRLFVMITLSDLLRQFGQFPEKVRDALTEKNRTSNFQCMEKFA